MFSLRRGLAALGAFTVANIREVLFLIGLSLVGGGLAMVWVPVALVVVGAMLLWLAIPVVRGPR